MNDLSSHHAPATLLSIQGADSLGSEDTNPFSTRYTRPGAVPFDFSGRTTTARLLEQFHANGCRGAIVGPHGSGKSALLFELIQALEAAGRNVAVVRLHDGKRSAFPRGLLKGLEQSAILVVDGFEQLSIWNRFRLLDSRRRQQFALLVTAHRRTYLPTLYRTGASFDLTVRLVERHLPSHDGRITSADIRRAWNRHAGNVREVFFELYDVFDERRRSRRGCMPY